LEKVAIYCRLSDEDRNKVSEFDESESIQNQKTLLTKYAIDKDWAIYKIYSDDDYSGLDKDRPEFNAMIKDAEERKFGTILCKHQSRFSRDMEIIEKYLHNNFQEWNIRFVSITDNVDTYDKGNKKARQINSLVNEWYCEDISEAIRATFSVKREEGKFIGSFATYGYKKDLLDRNKLIIDDEAAEVVRMIFDWYLEGYGTQHIAYLLNKRGIPNPSRYKTLKGLKFKNSSQTDGYGLWNRTTIRRILRNKMYLGNLVQGKRKKMSYKSKKVISKPENQWIIVENTHEPIISENIFDAVENRLNSKVRSSDKGKAHIFTTKLICMNCGSTMNKVTSGKNYQYLRCKLYTRDPSKNLCTSHTISLRELEEVICEKIRTHIKGISEDSLINKLYQENDIAKQKKLLEKAFINTKSEIEEKEVIIESLYVDKVKGLIKEDQFYVLNNNFIREKKGLLENKERIEKETLLYDHNKIHLLDVISQ